MKMPEIEILPIQRYVTGEIVYLDEMRQHGTVPQAFLELDAATIQDYQAQADSYPDGQRPSIMDEYEEHDTLPSKVIARCRALADQLLQLREADSELTFVDIVAELEPEDILAKLGDIAAGGALADQDKQLAIESDGKYYPILDFRKRDSKLVGAGLRIWGWDYPKTANTRNKEEQYKYPEHCLVYPANEKDFVRQLELAFSYATEESNRFTESVSLYISADGYANVSSQVWSMVYAESGYEGHGGTTLKNLSDEDLAAFGDLVAEIVGDNPQTFAMRISQEIEIMTEDAATLSAKKAILDLIDTTWPAQAKYFLTRVVEGADKTIAEQLRDEATASEGTKRVQAIIKEWNKNRQS